MRAAEYLRILALFGLQARFLSLVTEGILRVCPLLGWELWADLDFSWNPFSTIICQHEVIIKHAYLEKDGDRKQKCH